LVERNKIILRYNNETMTRARGVRCARGGSQERSRGASGATF